MHRAVLRARPALSIGTAVEVHNTFSSSWNRGFEVAAMTRGGYRLLRRSDGYVLPAEFVAQAVRREAHRAF